MRTFLQFVLLFTVAFLTVGCARNYYNIPRETFEKKVRILGVAPIFVDSESDIRHPEKDALVNIIRNCNRKNEKELVARLKETGTFFSVRFLEDDADKMFYNLLFRRERRDDASVVYNKYFYKLPELKEMISKNGLDAIMLTVVSGVTRQDTVHSGNLISYVESDYNFLIMTSQIFDINGNILWEYPNFRQRNPSLPALFELQYPDFDEAKANQIDRVEVKFKTIPGITRTLNKTEESSLQGNAQVSSDYASIYSDMVSMLKPEADLFRWWKKKEEKKGEQPPNTEALKQETAKPETLKPEATKPVTPITEAPKPEAFKPEVIKEEVIKEETIKEETLKPETK